MLEDKHDLSVGEFDSMPKMHYFYIISTHLRCLYVDVGLLFHYFHFEGVQMVCDAKREERAEGNEGKAEIPTEELAMTKKT